jgi:hypothetical protein
VACFNVNGLNHRKFANLTSMMDEHNISACIVTETKWSPDSPKWFLDEDTHSVLNTDYSDIHETPDRFRSVQRGGVCIITTVASGINTILVEEKRSTLVTAATWLLTHPSWSKNVKIAGIYRSPGQNPTPHQIQADIQLIATHMSPHDPKNIQLITGDLNARTSNAPDCPHSANLPPRRSDGAPTCPVGEQLLAHLHQHDWAIITNRKCNGDTLFTRHTTIHCNNTLVEQKSTIDYFLTPVEDFSHVHREGIVAYSGMELDSSDHNMLFVDLTIPEKQSNQAKPLPEFFPSTARPTYNLKELIFDFHTPRTKRASKKYPHSSPQQAFQQILQEETQPWLSTWADHPLRPPPSSTPDQALRWRQGKLNQACSELITHLHIALTTSVGKQDPQEHPPTPQRILPSPQLKTALTQRTAARAELHRARLERSPHLDTKRTSYRVACKGVSRLRSLQTRQALMSQFASITLTGDRTGEAWKQLNKHSKQPRLGLPTLVRDTQGNLMATPAESAAEWHSRRATIGQTPIHNPKFDTASLLQLLEEAQRISYYPEPPNMHPQLRHFNNNHPTKDEITRALNTCPNGKSCGPDNLPYEAFTLGGDQAINCLHTLFRICWNTELHPSMWDKAFILPLFKGGLDRHNIDNYRAITLLNTISKIYEEVLRRRITSVLDATDFISPTQGGFVELGGPQDSTYGFLTTLQLRQQQNLPTYVAFFDFKTAFPSTFKPLVWVRLAQAGITGRLWRVTRQLFQNVSSRVLHPLIPEDEYFSIPEGLREGSKLSPLLFNIAVNDMSDFFHSPPAPFAPHPLGVFTTTPNGTTVYTGCFQYADDVALLASSPQELETMIRAMQLYCGTRGITINYNKTKVMEIPAKNTDPPPTHQYTTQDENNALIHLQVVPHFTYLGVEIDRALTMTNALNATRASLWGAHHSAQKLGMRPWGLALHSRATVWKTFVMSQLNHRLPFLTEKQADNLQTHMNYSIKAMTWPGASATATAMELGIPSARALRLRSIAALHGRLQTANRRRISSILAAITTPMERPTPLTTSIKIALSQLSLQQHFPWVNPRKLPRPTPEDLNTATTPSPSRSPISEYRNTWSRVVEDHVRTYEIQTREAWLATPNTHATQYALDIHPHSTTCLTPHTPQKWLTLPLLMDAQQTLLRIRTMATPLLRHARFDDVDRDFLISTFHEAYCPLCAPPTSPLPPDPPLDTPTHMALVCPHLYQLREPLMLAIEREMGKLPRTPEGTQLTWPDLPLHQQLDALIGNPTRHSTLANFDDHILLEWQTKLLQATTPHLKIMIKDRELRLAD